MLSGYQGLKEAGELTMPAYRKKVVTELEPVLCGSMTPGGSRSKRPLGEMGQNRSVPTSR